jgi:hypothetical protein
MISHFLQKRDLLWAKHDGACKQNKNNAKTKTWLFIVWMNWLEKAKKAKKQMKQNETNTQFIKPESLDRQSHIVHRPSRTFRSCFRLPFNLSYSLLLFFAVYLLSPCLVSFRARFSSHFSHAPFYFGWFILRVLIVLPRIVFSRQQLILRTRIQLNLNRQNLCFWTICRIQTLSRMFVHFSLRCQVCAFSLAFCFFFSRIVDWKPMALQ